MVISRFCDFFCTGLIVLFLETQQMWLTEISLHIETFFKSDRISI